MKIRREKRLRRTADITARLRAAGALPKFKCPNCDQTLQQGDGHFVPPSFGDEGFFVCRPKYPNRTGG